MDSHLTVANPYRRIT